MDPEYAHCTAFDGDRQIASGPPARVAVAIKTLLAGRPEASVLIFDDATGKQIDFDLRGSDGEIAARLGEVPRPEAPRGPGRPRLGVVAREVTLLPRHWEWLAAQPGGASVALRKLVEEARRANQGNDRARAVQTRAYNFMSAMAGNLAGFEEATRALFAGDTQRFGALIEAWPADVRGYAMNLAVGDTIQ